MKADKKFMEESQKAEPSKAPPLYPITGEHLRSIFTNKKFVRKIEKINRIKNYEHGFIVRQSFTNRDFLLGSVRIGGCGDVSLTDGEELEKYEIDSDIDASYILMRLHSHPGDEARPSYPRGLICDENGEGEYDGDLGILAESRLKFARVDGLYIKPLGIIIPLNKGKIIKLLVFQERAPLAINLEELTERESEFDKIEGDAEKVAEGLEGTGWYRTCIIRYEKAVYKGLDSLDKFAFTPHVIDREKFLDFVKE